MPISTIAKEREAENQEVSLEEVEKNAKEMVGNEGSG